jgi:hypothetical protein
MGRPQPKQQHTRRHCDHGTQKEEHKFSQYVTRASEAIHQKERRQPHSDGGKDHEGQPNWVECGTQNRLAN